MPFSIAFAVAAALLVLLIFLNKKKAVNDERMSERHVHHHGISRFGGIALIASFIIAILVDRRLVITTPLFGILIASGAILIFGIIDDIKQLSWKVQLVFQAVVVAFVYSLGVRLQYVTNPFGGIILFTENNWGFVLGLLVVVVWVMFIMNSVNWIDGVDGVSAGIVSIGAMAMFFLSLRPEVNQPPVAIISVALLGGLAAFLIFNFHPAKILAGTSGSMFMGFILAALAIFAGAKIATTLLVLTIPIIDALWVIGERYRSGKSIFVGDKRHLHYRLLELGWSQKKICLFYYTITAAVAILALNTRAMGKVVTFSVVGLVMIGLLVFIRRKVLQKT